MQPQHVPEIFASDCNTSTVTLTYSPSPRTTLTNPSVPTSPSTLQQRSQQQQQQQHSADVPTTAVVKGHAVSNSSASPLTASPFNHSKFRSKVGSTILDCGLFSQFETGRADIDNDYFHQRDGDFPVKRKSENQQTRVLGSNRCPSDETSSGLGDDRKSKSGRSDDRDYNQEPPYSRQNDGHEGTPHPAAPLPLVSPNRHEENDNTSSIRLNLSPGNDNYGTTHDDENDELELSHVVKGGGRSGNTKNPFRVGWHLSRADIKSNTSSTRGLLADAADEECSHHDYNDSDERRYLEGEKSSSDNRNASFSQQQCELYQQDNDDYGYDDFDGQQIDDQDGNNIGSVEGGSQQIMQLTQLPVVGRGVGLFKEARDQLESELVSPSPTPRKVVKITTKNSTSNSYSHDGTDGGVISRLRQASLTSTTIAVSTTTSRSATQVTTSAASSTSPFLSSEAITAPSSQQELYTDTLPPPTQASPMPSQNNTDDTTTPNEERPSMSRLPVPASRQQSKSHTPSGTPKAIPSESSISTPLSKESLYSSLQQLLNADHDGRMYNPEGLLRCRRAIDRQYAAMNEKYAEFERYKQAKEEEITLLRQTLQETQESATRLTQENEELRNRLAQKEGPTRLANHIADSESGSPADIASQDTKRLRSRVHLLESMVEARDAKIEALHRQCAELEQQQQSESRNGAPPQPPSNAPNRGRYDARDSDDLEETQGGGSNHSTQIALKPSASRHQQPSTGSIDDRIRDSDGRDLGASVMSVADGGELYEGQNAAEIIEGLRKRISELEETVMNLEHSEEFLKRGGASMKQKLIQAQVREDSLTVELRAAARKLESKQAHYDNERADELNALEHDLKQQRLLCVSLKGQLEEERARVAAGEKEMSSLLAQVETLETRANQQSVQISQLRPFVTTCSELEEQLGEHRQVKAKLVEALQSTERLQGVVAQLEELVQTLQSDRRVLKSQVTSLTTSMKSQSSSQIEVLRGRLEELEERLAVQRQEHDNEITQLQLRSQEDIQGRDDDLRQKLSEEYEAKMEALKSDCRKLQKALVLRERELQEVMNANDLLREYNEEVDRRIEVLNTEQKKVAVMREQLDSLIELRANERVQAACSRYENKIERLKTHIRQLSRLAHRSSSDQRLKDIVMEEFQRHATAAALSSQASVFATSSTLGPSDTRFLASAEASQDIPVVSSQGPHYPKRSPVEGLSDSPPSHEIEDVDVVENSCDGAGLRERSSQLDKFPQKGHESVLLRKKDGNEFWQQRREGEGEVVEGRWPSSSASSESSAGGNKRRAEDKERLYEERRHRNFRPHIMNSETDGFDQEPNNDGDVAGRVVANKRGHRRTDSRARQQEQIISSKSVPEGFQGGIDSTGVIHDNAVGGYQVNEFQQHDRQIRSSQEDSKDRKETGVVREYRDVGDGVGIESSGGVGGGVRQRGGPISSGAVVAVARAQPSGNRHRGRYSVGSSDECQSNERGFDDGGEVERELKRAEKPGGRQCSRNKLEKFPIHKDGLQGGTEAGGIVTGSWSGDVREEDYRRRRSVDTECYEVVAVKAVEVIKGEGVVSRKPEEVKISRSGVGGVGDGRQFTSSGDPSECMAATEMLIPKRRSFDELRDLQDYQDGAAYEEGGLEGRRWGTEPIFKSANGGPSVARYGSLSAAEIPQPPHRQSMERGNRKGDERKSHRIGQGLAQEDYQHEQQQQQQARRVAGRSIVQQGSIDEEQNGYTMDRSAGSHIPPYGNEKTRGSREGPRSRTNSQLRQGSLSRVQSIATGDSKRVSRRRIDTATENASQEEDSGEAGVRTGSRPAAVSEVHQGSSSSAPEGPSSFSQPRLDSALYDDEGSSFNEERDHPRHRRYRSEGGHHNSERRADGMPTEKAQQEEDLRQQQRRVGVFTGELRSEQQLRRPSGSTKPPSVDPLRRLMPSSHRHCRSETAEHSKGRDARLKSLSMTSSQESAHKRGQTALPAELPMQPHEQHLQRSDSCRQSHRSQQHHTKERPASYSKNEISDKSRRSVAHSRAL